MKEQKDGWQGTLAPMILKTLEVLGPVLHGDGVARCIQRISGGLIPPNQGTLYPVLRKLEQESAFASEGRDWENHGKTAFYRPKCAGRKLLQAEARLGEQTSAIACRFFAVKGEN